jgi:hypothetical protein
MQRTSFITPAAVLVAIALGSAPAMADDQHHDRGRSRGESTQSRGRADGDHRQRADEGHTQRAVPRREVVTPRTVRPVVVAPRVVAPRIVAPRIIAPRHYGPVYRHYGPVYRPYAFRPRFNIGFGIRVGYPVAAYAYPYPVPVYGYAAPSAPVVVGPGSTVYGGVSLEMTPDDAAVYVDGAYAGVVRDFDGTSQPLTLATGTHRIEVQEEGYRPLEFDVMVQAGQVIPYQGQLERN